MQGGHVSRSEAESCAIGKQTLSQGLCCCGCIGSDAICLAFEQASVHFNGYSHRLGLIREAKSRCQRQQCLVPAGITAAAASCKAINVSSRLALSKARSGTPWAALPSPGAIEVSSAMGGCSPTWPAAQAYRLPQWSPGLAAAATNISKGPPEVDYREKSRRPSVRLRGMLVPPLRRQWRPSRLSEAGRP